MNIKIKYRNNKTEILETSLQQALRVLINSDDAKSVVIIPTDRSGYIVFSKMERQGRSYIRACDTRVELEKAKLNRWFPINKQILSMYSPR